jgi:hypothetical protein
MLEEEKAIAFSDIRKLFDEHGSLIAPHQLPDDITRAVAAIEIIDLPDGGSKYKYKLWDKGKALDRLEKIFGMFAPDKHEVEVKGDMPEEEREALKEVAKIWAKKKRQEQARIE